jgi:hypothetical protein
MADEAQRDGAVSYKDLKEAAKDIGIDYVGVKKLNLIRDFVQKVLDVPPEEEENLSENVTNMVKSIVAAYDVESMEDVLDEIDEQLEEQDKGEDESPPAEPPDEPPAEPPDEEDKSKKEKKEKKEKKAKAPKPPKEKKPKKEKPKKEKRTAATVKVALLVADNPEASTEDLQDALAKEGYKVPKTTIVTVARFAKMAIEAFRNLHKK